MVADAVDGFKGVVDEERTFVNEDKEEDGEVDELDDDSVNADKEGEGEDGAEREDEVAN